MFVRFSNQEDLNTFTESATNTAGGQRLTDGSTHEQLWSERLVVNSPANEIRADRRAVLELVERGVIHYASFERRVELVRLEGDVAIVMGGETVRPLEGAPMAGRTVERRFTNVWRREAGGWRLVARHANVVPAQ